MIRVAMTALALLAASAAFADDRITFTRNMKVESLERADGTPLFRQFIVSGDFGIKTALKLEEGGCLRGPLTLYDREGWEAFKLPAGVSYPAGCEKAR